jgi:hypothetical protein
VTVRCLPSLLLTLNYVHRLISAELLRKDQNERLTMTDLLLEPVFHGKVSPISLHSCVNSTDQSGALVCVFTAHELPAELPASHIGRAHPAVAPETAGGPDRHA